VKKRKLIDQILSVRKEENKLNVSYYIILLGYALIPVFIPNFNTLDSNGVKFLSIAILNVISFTVFICESRYKQTVKSQSQFFRNYISLAYSLFLVISLLSFFIAVNVIESLMNFVKIFTVFFAVYVLYRIFSSNRGYLLPVAIALALLLLLDSLTVFYQIPNYINGKLTLISDIKSVYSNKNILAAAIFVKLPVSLWLIFFTTGWTKRLGYLTVFAATLATLIMSTRSFYLGLGILSVAMIFFVTIHFALKRKKTALLMLARFACLLVFAFVIYSFMQKYLYPKNTDINYNSGVVSRLSSITILRQGEHSISDRLDSWRRSLQLISDHPWLGVGSGNWKLESIKYEYTKPDAGEFSYMYKNHNDFIEITAETGIFGGLAYLAIFILILISFIRISFRGGSDDIQLKFLFFAAFGILAYSVDAFFNFPADRPEIQVLFAFYVASAISSSREEYFFPHNAKVIKSPMLTGKNKKSVNLLKGVIVMLLLLLITYVLLLNVKSLHYQTYVYSDIKRNKFTHSANFIIKGFPCIPNLNCTGGSVTVDKARYLINDKRYREAISDLLADYSNPNSCRREYCLAVAYDKMGMPDSAFEWIKVCYKIKPLYKEGVMLMSSMLYHNGRQQEAMQIIDHYVKQVKINPDAWLMAVSMHWKSGQQQRALMLLDSARQWLPGDTALARNWNNISNEVRIKPLKDLYDSAKILFNGRSYSESLKILNMLISRDPGYSKAYELRAYCFYFKGNYVNCINDIDSTFHQGIINYALLNLRGINYRNLGRYEDACRDFQAAKNNGNADGATNYRKFCEKKADIRKE
jgi:putative inorganic carbon (hco3(-)) transporter